MQNSNTKLPQNLQELAKQMKAHQAVPLAIIDEIPFVAIRLSDTALLKQELSSHIKATILNIEHEKNIYAIAFLQFRLNSDPTLTFTVFYNLKVDKQYQECQALLAMNHYGLLLLTQEYHDFVKFKAQFQADFSLQTVARNARNKASDYSVESFLELSHFFYTYHKNDRMLWDYLESIAPLDKECYAYIKMQAQDT